MIIEIVNGTAQIKCIPKKKKNKIDKLKIISSPCEIKKKLNYYENKNDVKDEDNFFFNPFNDYEKHNELSNNSFYDYLDNEGDLVRKHLFLGKKTIF